MSRRRIAVSLLSVIGNAALIGWVEPRRVLFAILAEGGPQYRSEGGGWRLRWLRDLHWWARWKWEAMTDCEWTEAKE